MIEFDIICHMDQWTLKDFALRPFKIAAEIDTIFINMDYRAALICGIDLPIPEC